VRRLLTIPALMVSLTMAGCGEDAAKDVPKVTTEAPKPVPSDSAKPVETKEGATPAVVAPASSTALVIAPATSKIEFIGSKKVGGTHNGGFKAFNGTVELVDGKPDVKSIAVDIDTKSIFSDDEKLTGHLKNQDFFEVEKYPTAKFVTTEIKAGGDKGATHTIVGNLTLHGVTKSITIPATVTVVGDSMTLKSEFALNKNDFGMTFTGPGGVIRDEVVIKLDVKAAKKA
jgi:polyisoprenoid-binding protein YceI